MLHLTLLLIHHVLYCLALHCIATPTCFDRVRRLWLHDKPVVLLLVVVVAVLSHSFATLFLQASHNNGPEELLMTHVLWDGSLGLLLRFGFTPTGFV